MAQGTGRLYGYASASSVRQGSSIKFHISTYASVTSYDIHIFRVGATGLISMTTISNLPGREYTCGPVGVPAGQEGIALGCNWPVAYTLQVPANWPSGAYMANLVDADDRPGKYGAYVHFIVTENQPGSTADIIFHFPTFTWQAYNKYGNWGFYTNLPARWLESEGYQVDYVASEDIHTDPSLLFQYKLFITAGHDEYWSKEIRDNVDAYINAGGNVAIFSGNTAFRQVRYNLTDRTLVCYKNNWPQDPLFGTDNIRVATEFARIPVPAWPENATIGPAFRNGGYVNTQPGQTGNSGQYTVYHSGHWVFTGTGLQDGNTFLYETQKRVEVDGALFIWQNGLPVVTGMDGTPLNYTILGIQPASNGHATMGLYSRGEGGTVFNAATMGWGRGLWPENNVDYQTVRQITRNVINQLRIVAPPPPPIYPLQQVSFTSQPLTPLQGTTVTFMTFITPSNTSPPVSYNWQFGDGTPDVITDSSIISHTYNAASTYTVAVTATNIAGQTAFRQPVTIASLPSQNPESKLFLPMVVKRSGE